MAILRHDTWRPLPQDLEMAPVRPRALVDDLSAAIIVTSTQEKEPKCFPILPLPRFVLEC